MSKIAAHVLGQRSSTLLLSCLSLLGLLSMLFLFFAHDTISILWLKLGGSPTIAKEYVGGHCCLSQPSPPPFQHDDPSSCLSRTQQRLYRNPQYEKPTPPNLLAAWKSYTHMHKSCFRPNWTWVFLNRDSFNSEDCQYLVYIESREGLGNGILSLASAFVFAMATNRVLLVDNIRNIPKLICEPFPESSWLLPEDFPYKELLAYSSLGPFMHHGINATAVRLNLLHTFNRQDQQIFCEEAYIHLKCVKWVAWTSNQYFVPNFFLVPSFWDRIHPIFGDDIDHLFTYISRLLFLPDNKTWAIILRGYWSYLSGATSRLGVQVRLHGMPKIAGYNSEANDKVMKCLVEHDLLPCLSEYDNITKLSMLHGMRVHDRDADIVVLVASLQGRYAEIMKDNYGLMPTKGTKMVRVHTVSHQGVQSTGFHQAQLAFVEMWLLSFSDNLATSGLSTFGYIAQGLGGLEPLIIIFRKKDGAKSCVWGQSVEPCNHYPRTPDQCLGANARLSEEHKHWIRSHLRRCQDHHLGWQIVHNGVEGTPIAFDFL